MSYNHLTWYLTSPVMWVKSRNSNCNVVTSETELSDPHRGGWASPVLRLTSENGTPD